MNQITVAAREAARQQYRYLALAEADKRGRSLVCEHPDVRAHDTCLGLEAAVSQLGCLCECHDGDAIGPQP